MTSNGQYKCQMLTNASFKLYKNKKNVCVSFYTCWFINNFSYPLQHIQQRRGPCRELTYFLILQLQYRPSLYLLVKFSRGDWGNISQVCHWGRESVAKSKVALEYENDPEKYYRRTNAGGHSV